MAIPNPKWDEAGPQVILKSDFQDIEQAILGQPLVRMQPSLIYVGVATIRVEATADCPAETALTGMPNIMNPVCQVSGGLSDGKTRSISANVSCIVPDNIWGDEQSSQWYAVFAIAGDDDTAFTLKAMPFMRVKSQTGQAIKCGTLVDPSAGLDYGFTEDEFVGGLLYFLTGDSRGLMRSISANDVDTDTRITYTGDALIVAQDDWFIILPPTNFRLIGTFLNNAAGNIRNFSKQGHVVDYIDLSYATNPADGVVEDILLCCPLATRCIVKIIPGGAVFRLFGHPDSTTPLATTDSNYTVLAQGSVTFPVRFCTFTTYRSDGCNIYAVGHEYPAGMGF